MFLVSPGGLFQQFRQALLLRQHGLVALTVLGRCTVFRNGQTGLLRQILDSLDEGHAAMLHQEGDGVAIGSAAEAVVELLGGADAERGGFFAVKRAQAHEVGPPFFELHVAAHHLHHVNAG